MSEELKDLAVRCVLVLTALGSGKFKGPLAR